MAGNICTAITNTKVSLSAATVKTVLQIKAPTNQRLRVKGWGVYFDGVTAANTPVDVRVVRQTSLGTMSAGVVASLSSLSETPLTSVQYNATAEPTNSGATGETDRITCHPQQWYETRFSQDQEIIVHGGGYLGIECTAAQAVGVRAKFIFEE